MPAKKRKLNNKYHFTGFTLSEVIIALALLIVAIVPVLKALTFVHLNSTLVERRTKNMLLAQAKLDDIKARSIYNYSGSFSGNDTVLEGSYLCNVSDTGSGTDLRTITISAGFDTDGDTTLDADEIKVTLSTYLANRWL